MADEQGADGADSGLSTTETTPKMVPLTELQAERAKVREAREALRALQKEHGERGDAFTALQERIKALEPLEAELTGLRERETARLARLSEANTARLESLSEAMRELAPEGLDPEALSAWLDKASKAGGGTGVQTQPLRAGGRSSAGDPTGVVITEAELAWIAKNNPGLSAASPEVQRRFLDKQIPKK